MAAQLGPDQNNASRPEYASQRRQTGNGTLYALDSIMARSRLRRGEPRGPTRLQTVQREAHEKAVFWDRTSISMFLGGLAFLGLIAVLIGGYGLSSGEISFGHYFKLDYSTSGWRFTCICIAILFTGINFIMPLPMFWTMNERRTVVICACFLAFNFLLFMYAFIIDVVARGDFFVF